MRGHVVNVRDKRRAGVHRVTESRHVEKPEIEYMRVVC